MYCLNDNTQIMAQHLTQYLVELPDVALAADRIPELRLDHRKGRFDIRALMYDSGLKTPHDYT